MIQRIDTVKLNLMTTPKTWLITGVAGFIGSNLLENLLLMDQQVVGLDNFSTGYQENLNEVLGKVSPEQAARFRFVEGDIRILETCKEVCEGIDIILHQAALGSVPRSIKNPIATNQSNIDGFLNMLVAARDADIPKFVYAASSSTYGDSLSLPKVEHIIGKPMSPYAVTKYMNELYAEVFGRLYGLKCIGLRYFNVFGRRQNPNGAYAAVIPQWYSNLLKGKSIFINGDGETSRDFCYVDNAVQANLLAAVADDPEAVGQVYNVAFGEKTTLIQLFEMIRGQIVRFRADVAEVHPIYRDFRPGDVRHSLADITKAGRLLGYCPTHSVREGLEATTEWYVTHLT